MSLNDKKDWCYNLKSNIKRSNTLKPEGTGAVNIRIATKIIGEAQGQNFVQPDEAETYLEIIKKVGDTNVEVLDGAAEQGIITEQEYLIAASFPNRRLATLLGESPRKDTV